MSSEIPIDDLARPWLPWPLRLVNAVGGLMSRIAVSLDAQNLLSTACTQTGLDDYGDPWFLEPLRVFARALDREADLSAFGRVMNRQQLLQLLRNRLRLEDLIRRHPEILDERIDRPIVIAGLPRSGTTHLHHLFAQDRRLRVLPYWESLEPIPVEGEPSGRDGSDPRIARAERGLALLHRALPLFPAMHEMSADGPHEEIQLLAMTFSTELFEVTAQVPSYVAWYRGTEQTPAYLYLKRVLQALQWLRGPRRWVLKSPQHLDHLVPLTTAFPDAFVVWTHRDAVRTVASLATMAAYGRRMQVRRPDVAAIGRQQAKHMVVRLRAAIRDRDRIPAGRILDVPFREFMKDNLAMMERICAFAEHPLDEPARAAMRAFLDANPLGKHGRIRYRLEDVGLDPAEQREALRFYQERFDVAVESDADGGSTSPR